MSLRDERLARQQERFRNKGGLSKFEKSANKLVLSLNPVTTKPEHVEGRVPPPQSPLGPLANSTAVAKATEDVAAPTAYSNSPLILTPDPLPAPTTDQPKRRATKPKTSSSRPKKKAAPPPAKEVDQSDDDDELAIPLAPVPIPIPSTRKSKHLTTAKPARTQRQGSAKPVDNGAAEVQPIIAKKKNRTKPSRSRARVEVDASSPKEVSPEPSPSALRLPPKPKKTEPQSVQPEQRPETEGDVKKSATEAEAPSTRTQKRKTRTEELPAEKAKRSGKAATSRSKIMRSSPVVEEDGDDDDVVQGPPKKQRRRVLVNQPCTWDAEYQAPRRVLKLPSHK